VQGVLWAGCGFYATRRLLLAKNHICRADAAEMPRKPRESSRRVRSGRRPADRRLPVIVHNVRGSTAVDPR